ncbi:30S ribosomal protein S16 [Alteracholeplasma palmae J233]|uniref:Small ribosomal subunit protein bS16 n=1 Tax=Alteracholeplasma palmae (strain ATCC 49389 / J233) TaxID=1318466 RepID=U4KK01_ALTPJ|nr:30S ribosomal protein S16 [Alteracholeplasma palmae]CCV63827.1 30S ribosomal protein S16 [Alteracholeplasma palmae J233]
MAVKIRLQRFGAHKRPFYRIVASESTKPRDGKFLEILGTYEPIDGVVKFDNDKVQKWISNGAQPTETVRSLFKKYNLK